MNFPHISKSSRSPRLLAQLLLGALLIGAGCKSSSSDSKDSAPEVQTFATPDAAMQSLVQALRTNNDADLKSILGKEASEVLSSGDEVADKNRIEKFLTLYDQAHHLERVDDDTMNVIVGDKDWPMPIPIVRDSKEGKWYFDTEAGKDEVLNRRIGQNELDVIQVCEAIVDAQREYAERDPDNNGIPEYARKFLSDPGKKNGLYWPTAEGEAPSPLGPLVADAVEQGYSAAQSTDHAPAPYHGYYYRILTEQGDAAPGGALDYVIQGKFIGGFGVVAYPSEYGNSGIMTFIINHDGVLYQKDLGESTEKQAKAMKAFNPGKGWTKVDPAATSQPAPTP